MIDSNEELECYIGMKVNDVQNDLTDKDIPHRVLTAQGRASFDLQKNRVNIVIDDFKKVTKIYYG